jgi:hypothetical protein
VVKKTQITQSIAHVFESHATNFFSKLMETISDALSEIKEKGWSDEKPFCRCWFE